MTDMPELQLFDALDAATEAALTASIERFGVIVPVVRDQHGRVLDGHHRARIAEKLGVFCPTTTQAIRDEEEAREIARTLNTDRRHLTVEQRREIVADLRSNGHSLRAIAGATGVSEPTVRRDLAGASPDAPERVAGVDGKSYPARRPEPSEADKAEAVAEFPELVELPPKEAVRLAGELRKIPPGPELDKRRKAASTWHRVYNQPPADPQPDLREPLHAVTAAAIALSRAIDRLTDEAWDAADSLLAENTRGALADAARAALDAAKPRSLRRVK